MFGLVRSADKMDALKAIGIKPVLGTLEDQEVLAKYAQLTDAVINTANSDHRQAIETIINSLKGSGKTFIHTSGSSVVGDDALGETESPKIYADDTWARFAIASNSRIRAVNARALLGWKPTGESILDWISLHAKELPI